jgi:hypothetical protein
LGRLWPYLQTLSMAVKRLITLGQCWKGLAGTVDLASSSVTTKTNGLRRRHLDRRVSCRRSCRCQNCKTLPPLSPPGLLFLIGCGVQTCRRYSAGVGLPKAGVLPGWIVIFSAENRSDDSTISFFLKILFDLKCYEASVRSFFPTAVVRRRPTDRWGILGSPVPSVDAAACMRLTRRRDVS